MAGIFRDRDYEVDGIFRRAKRRPRRYRTWCNSCDAAFVEAGKKCPKCGNRNGHAGDRR